MSSASTSAGLPDGKYMCYIKDDQIISIYSGTVSMGGMTRFNHEGKAYECNTSDLMDISVEMGRGDNKDDPDDKGDKPNDGDKPNGDDP